MSTETDRLADYLVKNFPDEIGAGNSQRGESTVDVAIRLLNRLKIIEAVFETKRKMETAPTPKGWAGRLTVGNRTS